MATAEELRRQREEQSIFSQLYALAREQNAALAGEGRRPVLGGLLSKEPVQGIDTLRYEGIGNMLAGLLSPAAKAIDAPMAAYQGNIPREDMLGEAFNTAGMAMLGGGAVAGRAIGDFDPTITRVFAGPKAKTADLGALKKARELSARRRDPDEIFRETGWFKGADGEWRFEISDDKARFVSDEKRLPEYQLMRSSDMGSVLQHDDLFAAYPDLRNVLTTTGQRDVPTGSFQPYVNRADRKLPDIEEEINVAGPDVKDIESLLLHEIDHAIAKREGFSRGANRSDALDKILSKQRQEIKDIEQRIEARQSELGLSPFDYRPETNDPELLQLRREYDARVGRSPSDQEVHNVYLQNMGEVSARNVQSRMAMTPDERRGLPPRLTEDVPREAQWRDDMAMANASPIGGLLAQSGVSEEQARKIEDYLNRIGLLQ